MDRILFFLMILSCNPINMLRELVKKTYISDGVRAVQECKLHRQFEVSHRLLVEIEFMKMTSFDFAISRDE